MVDELFLALIVGGPAFESHGDAFDDLDLLILHSCFNVMEYVFLKAFEHLILSFRCV